MSGEHVKSAFDPFFSTKEDGTGLGLPLSLGIVENHGGRIRIDSTEEIGTAVVIEWPVKPGALETKDMADENDPGS